MRIRCKICDNEMHVDNTALCMKLYGKETTKFLCYECMSKEENFPIEKPTIAQLIELALEEASMTQKQLASEIGVSPSRVNDYITGRAEPTLKVAKSLCKVLSINPSAMLGL